MRIENSVPAVQLCLCFQLPIYSAPPLKSKYIEEQPGHLQQQLSAVRQTTGRYFGWCQVRKACTHGFLRFLTALH